MAEDETFTDLLLRVRAGEDAASTEFVARYSPEIERVVRIRLREPLLRSSLDTADICQSVMMAFFTRAQLGDYDLQEPRDLLRLLVTMARHKLLNHVRKARGARIVEAAGSPEQSTFLNKVPARCETPSLQVGGNELVEKARALLTDEERELADYRKAGKDWDEIAQRMGSTAEAARKRFTRAMDRVLDRLDL